MPRNKYPEETRNKIVDASVKLFLTKGYDKTTILDIVAQLQGLTRGAFYHHFKTKEDVLDAILERMGEVGSMMDVRMEGLSGLDKLKVMLKMQKMYEQSPYKEALVVMWSLTKNPEFDAVHMSIKKHSAKHEIQPIIEEGIKDGSIKAHANAKLIAEFMAVILNLWLSPVHFENTDDDIKEKVKFFRQLTKGVGCDVFDDEVSKILIEVSILLNNEVRKTLSMHERVK